jgi:SAM-dependent methyltransferase
MSVQRSVWEERDVTNVAGAEFAARTYIEQLDVRRYLARIVSDGNIHHVCDVGAGYGRLTPVLKEFCDHVVAFEREPALVEKGSFLHPTIEYRMVESLAALPAGDAEFDFALVFTVLQHLGDSPAERAVAELRRVIQPGGYILVCEETNDSYVYGDLAEEHSAFTIGRSVEQYKKWMSPFTLIRRTPRRTERCPVGPEFGQYLLFRRYYGGLASELKEARPFR